MQYCSRCRRTFSSQTQFCPEDGSRLETRTEFDIGMVIREKYQILELLGEGGMGRVYKVKDLYFKYGRNLGAMKIPSAQLAANPTYLERFIDEAAKARALDHPNIVRVENVDKTENGVPFLVMELVEGLPLRAWIEREKRFEWRLATVIAREIATALAAAHSEGLVHCDIKPENILSVNRESPVPLKVTDFGLAKATEALRSRLSQVRGSTLDASSVAGSLDYMAPEQTLSRRAVTEASDIYSLGITLHELLTGKPPFAHYADAEEIKRAHREEQPVSLRALPGVPQPLVRLIESMVEKNPGRRPSAAEVVSSLNGVLTVQLSTTEKSAGVRKETLVDPAVPPYRAGSLADIDSPAARRYAGASEQTAPLSCADLSKGNGELPAQSKRDGTTGASQNTSAAGPLRRNLRKSGYKLSRFLFQSRMFPMFGIGCALLILLLAFFTHDSKLLNDLPENAALFIMWCCMATVPAFSLAIWRLRVAKWVSAVICFLMLVAVIVFPGRGYGGAFVVLGTLIPAAFLWLKSFLERKLLLERGGLTS